MRECGSTSILLGSQRAFSRPLYLSQCTVLYFSLIGFFIQELFIGTYCISSTENDESKGNKQINKIVLYPGILDSSIGNTTLNGLGKKCQKVLPRSNGQYREFQDKVHNLHLMGNWKSLKLFKQ